MALLANHWAAHGQPVVLVTFGTPREPDFFGVREEVERVYLDAFRIIWNPVKGFNTLRQIVVLRRALTRAAPDIVISFIVKTNLLTLLATRGLGLPVIVSDRLDPQRSSTQPCLADPATTPLSASDPRRRADPDGPVLLSRPRPASRSGHSESHPPAAVAGVPARSGPLTGPTHRGLGPTPPAEGLRPAAASIQGSDSATPGLVAGDLGRRARAVSPRGARGRSIPGKLRPAARNDHGPIRRAPFG